MKNIQTQTVESSPTTFEIPSDPKANLEWRTTGNLPGARKEGAGKEKTPASEASATSEEASAESSETAETAPASATGSKQEKGKAKPDKSASDRLNELLTDLRTAGLTPAELKTFKREAKAATAETPSKAAPEFAAKPKGLEAPVKPKRDDKNEDGSAKYATWESFEEAKDDYFEKLSDFKSKLAVLEDRQARATEAQQQTLKQKVAEAKTRYGDQTEATIGNATREILGVKDLSPVIGQIINESPVLVDVMYVLGSKAEDLASFVELAKANPGAAIRKWALLEHLVQEELASGAGKGKSAAAAAETGNEPVEGDQAQRDASGRFQRPPAKHKPAAPPPPDELNTRGSAPGDPVAAAVRDNDFRAFKAAEDARDLAKRKGR